MRRLGVRCLLAPCRGFSGFLAGAGWLGLAPGTRPGEGPAMPCGWARWARWARWASDSLQAFACGLRAEAQTSVSRGRAGGSVGGQGSSRGRDCCTPSPPVSKLPHSHAHPPLVPLPPIHPRTHILTTHYLPSTPTPTPTLSSIHTSQRLPPLTAPDRPPNLARPGPAPLHPFTPTPPGPRCMCCTFFQ